MYGIAKMEICLVAAGGDDDGDNGALNRVSDGRSNNKRQRGVQHEHF